MARGNEPVPVFATSAWRASWLGARPRRARGVPRAGWAACARGRGWPRAHGTPVRREQRRAPAPTTRRTGALPVRRVVVGHPTDAGTYARVRRCAVRALGHPLLGAVPGPVGVEGAFVVDALVGVGSEVVPQALHQRRRQA